MTLHITALHHLTLYYTRLIHTSRYSYLFHHLSPRLTLFAPHDTAFENVTSTRHSTRDSSHSHRQIIIHIHMFCVSYDMFEYHIPAMSYDIRRLFILVNKATSINFNHIRCIRCFSVRLRCAVCIYSTSLLSTCKFSRYHDLSKCHPFGVIDT
jgi:hypothetical protein